MHEDMKEIDRQVRETLAKMGVIELSAVIWVIERKRGKELAMEIFELIFSELKTRQCSEQITDNR